MSPFRRTRAVDVPVQRAAPGAPHRDWRVCHEVAAPTSVETRDVARALRAAGYEVRITSPDSLTAPWTVTAYESLGRHALDQATLVQAVARLRAVVTGPGGRYVQSVAEPPEG